MRGRGTAARELVVRPSPLRIVLFWLAAAAFLGVSLFFATGGMDHAHGVAPVEAGTNVVVGVIGVMVGGLGVVAIPFLPRRPLLWVTPDGITYPDTSTSTRLVPWRDVTGVTVRRPRLQTFLVVGHADPDAFLAGVDRRRRRTAEAYRRAYGTPVVVPAARMPGSTRALATTIAAFRPPGEDPVEGAADQSGR